MTAHHTLKHGKEVQMPARMQDQAEFAQHQRMNERLTAIERQDVNSPDFMALHRDELAKLNRDNDKLTRLMSTLPAEQRKTLVHVMLLESRRLLGDFIAQANWLVHRPDLDRAIEQQDCEGFRRTVQSLMATLVV